MKTASQNLVRHLSALRTCFRLLFYLGGPLFSLLFLVQRALPQKKYKHVGYQKKGPKQAVSGKLDHAHPDPKDKTN